MFVEGDRQIPFLKERGQSRIHRWECLEGLGTLKAMRENIMTQGDIYRQGSIGTDSDRAGCRSTVTGPRGKRRLMAGLNREYGGS